MAKKNTIWLTMPVSPRDLGDYIACENDFGACLEVIEAIDEAHQDWEFTRKLKDLADRLMSQVDDNKVN